MSNALNFTSSSKDFVAISSKLTRMPWIDVYESSVVEPLCYWYNV